MEAIAAAFHVAGPRHGYAAAHQVALAVLAKRLAAGVRVCQLLDSEDRGESPFRYSLSPLPCHALRKRGIQQSRRILWLLDRPFSRAMATQRSTIQAKIITL